MNGNDPWISHQDGPVCYDIPELSTTMFTLTEVPLWVLVGAETWAPWGRFFLRVLVDDRPMSPSDVVFDSEGGDGTRSFAFVSTSVPSGTHEVKAH